MLALWDAHTTKNVCPLSIVKSTYSRVIIVES